MSYVKKMMLIDPTQYSHQPVPDGLGSSISSLDQTIQNILNNKVDGDDEYTKAQRYSQALQRYLTLTDKYRNRPLGKVEITSQDSPTETTSSIEPAPKDKSGVRSVLHHTLPTSFHKKGDALLNHLESLPGVRWDDQLRLIVDDKTVAESNLVDLIDDLVRDRKTAKAPKGWGELARALKRSNVPKALIHNSSRRNSLIKDIPTLSRGKPTRQKTNRLKNWVETNV